MSTMQPTNGEIRRHLSIGMNSMFETVQLPTTVSDLASGLSDVDGNNLPLNKKKIIDD